MDASNTLLRQGHRLLQVGVGLFLFTSFEGFAIPFFAAPLLGRSAHSQSALLGIMLLALGLAWPRLHLGAAAARLASHLFGLCDHGRLHHCRHLGRRQIDHAVGGRPSGNSLAGTGHYGCRLLVCTDGNHRIRPHLLGPLPCTGATGGGRSARPG